MSSSSLYGVTSNVTVSANNLTTLYNATTGNVVTASVPDRNFTTLYTNQTEINPTYAYGNSNVEAFLNSGTDGANSVQNIHMSGNIYVGGSSYLGNVGNVHINGGNSGYVLTTDGSGNLAWIHPTNDGSIVPYIHFDVTETGNNQSFTDSNLEFYASSELFNLFKNGVNIEPFYYTKTSNNTVQINILLNTGDTIDILATGATGGGTLPAGTTGQLQFNGGYNLAASSAMSFDQANSTLTVQNFAATGVTNLNDVSNVYITGGSANYVLRTDGSGHLSWIPQADANGHPAGNVYEVQFNSGSNSFAATSNFVFNQSLNTLFVPHINTEGANISNISGANVTGTVANANFATYSNSASFSNIANISNVSYSVSGSNVVGQVSNSLTSGTVYSSAQPAITSVGNLTGLTSNGIVNFSGSSNLSLGSVANIHITGGSANYFLKTDGAGNLSWSTVSSGSGTPGGSNTYVQFNDANTFGGNSSFTFNKTSSTLTVPNANVDTLSEIANATEIVVIPGSAVSGTYTYNTLLSSIVQCTTNTTGNFVLNFTNLSIGVGRARSFAFINKNASGSTYYCTGISIAGSAQTVNWLGGSAPTTGSTTNIYNITIIQTSAGVYSVFASVGSY